jgi:hypothetical protein
MPAWIARRQFPRTPQEEKYYLNAVGGRVHYWSNIYPHPKPIGPEKARISDRYVRELARRELGATEIARAELDVGQFYPRIWRGERHWCAAFNEDSDHRLILAIQAVDILLGKLRDVFKTVHPVGRNRRSYGHEIRSLLILACTEVESAWKAILRANGFSRATAGAKSWTTRDYVKLLKPLRLREWGVAMPLFLNYGVIVPFQTWREVDPTGSLRWYAAYNAAKHDREEAFSKATLGMLVEAAAAAFVMVAAQVGPATISEGRYSIRDFAIVWRPSWKLSEEYVPPTNHHPRTDSSSPLRPVWSPVHYPFR